VIINNIKNAGKTVKKSRCKKKINIHQQQQQKKKIIQFY